jgi:ribosomal-protein-alanine N-acetyltransferase
MYEKRMSISEKMEGMPRQVLNTEHLRLEPLQLSHAPRLFEALRNPALHRWTMRDYPSSLEAFTERVKAIEGRASADKTIQWLYWASFLKGSEQIVGQVGVSWKGESGEAHLTCFTFEEHWQKGYAKEACQALVREVFETWPGRSIVIEMDTRNLAAVRLAESIGAKRVTVQKSEEFHNGEWGDEYVYSLDPVSDSPH